MDIKIIPASDLDIKEAAKLSVAAWEPIRESTKKDFGEELFEAFFEGWEKEKADTVSAELRGGRGYIAKSGDTVVGFISFKIEKNGSVGVIGTNAVHPGYRRAGIAGRLYKTVIERMREEGARFVKVSTGGDDGHAPARRAYEKIGFVKNIPSVTYYKKL